MATPFAEKQDRAVSPKGLALWPFLTEPNKKWRPEYGEYSVSLILEPGKEAAAFIKELEKVRDEYYETLLMELPPVKAKKLSKREVYTDQLDAADEETGNFIFKFASGAGGISRKGKAWEFKPRLYDSGANLITGKLNVGNGSVIQVNYMPSAYMLATNGSVGCKLYLNDVMIHKLVEFDGGDPGFKATDDGFKYDEGTPAIFSKEDDVGEHNPNANF